MATKKQTQTRSSIKTATISKPKYYVVMDEYQDIIAYGTMSDIEQALNEYNDGDDEHDELSFSEWIALCTIYELGAGKKLKYTPAKYTF